MSDTTAFSHHFPISIRWGDMDAYGHVNNTIYYRYFESARIDYFERHVLPLIGNEMPIVVLAEMQCKFEKEICYPADIVVKSKINRLGNSSFSVYAEIWHQERRCAHSSATLVWLNGKTKAPQAIPEAVAAAIKQLEQL